MSHRYFVSSSPVSLTRAFIDVTIEAEYGDVCVEGRLLTLAHHGDRAWAPCPCQYSNRPDLAGLDLKVGLSHLDLDSLGGCMAVANRKSNDEYFWLAVARVDVEGPHRLPLILNEIAAEVAAGCNEIEETWYENVYSSTYERIHNALHAYWAWSEKNKVFPARDGSVTDITDKVEEAMDILDRILALSPDKDLIEEGKKWAAAKVALDKDSFVENKDGVIYRVADCFVNHLYGNGVCVVAYNTKFKSVTVSLAEAVDGMNCCKIVQSLWGPEAGGHAGIAGSPRGREMTEEDARVLFNEMVQLMK